MDETQDTQSQESIGQTAETAKDVAGKAKNVAGKAVDGVKNVGKTIGKAVSKTGKKAAGAVAKNPLVWKIALIAGIVLLAFILLVVVIAAIVYAVTASDYDAENGLLSSIYGISGDKYYGARFVYQDDDAANLEIQDNYLKFTYNILNDTKNQINLAITLSEDYSNDANIITIATNFANELIPEQAHLSLAQCVTAIDHFGFTDQEITLVIDSIAQSLKNNTFGGNAWAGATLDDIKSTLSEKMQTDTYLQYKNVTPKIYVWDYILDGDDATLEKLPKKDYYGFIFMPKETVTMKSTSFIFVIDGGYGVDVTLKQKQSGQEANALGGTENANASWFYDNHMQEFYECEFDVTLNTFEAIDSNNLTALSTPTSIYSMLGSGTYSTYFNTTESYDGLTLIQNVADSNYIYLEMVNLDEYKSPFNFAEQLVEYN